MKLELRKIFEGFRNSIVPPAKLKELISEVSKERLSICKDCPYNSTRGEIGIMSKCLACGCFLIPKSKCLSCNCGLESQKLPPKWIAITSEQEDEAIQKTIKKDESDNSQ